MKRKTGLDILVAQGQEILAELEAILNELKRANNNEPRYRTESADQKRTSQGDS